MRRNRYVITSWEIECYRMEITTGNEELCNSHGKVGIGASYLCYSNCDKITMTLYLL